MNLDPKILLTVEQVGSRVKSSKPVKKGKVVTFVNDTIPAYLKIKICVDTYNYMVSTEMPDWIHSIKQWRKMTKTQRLENHLNHICQRHHGIKYSYKVIDD